MDRIGRSTYSSVRSPRTPWSAGVRCGSRQRLHGSPIIYLHIAGRSRQSTWKQPTRPEYRAAVVKRIAFAYICRPVSLGRQQ